MARPGKRTVQVFSAGCTVCEDTVRLIKEMVCENCSLEILDMRKPEVASRAKELRVQRLPALVVNGKLAECCSLNAVNAATLQALGVGELKYRSKGGR